MPGHFTHIFTARRVADYLSSGNMVDWPIRELAHYTPEFCGQVMKDWEKFTAIGAIGPDLFYFSQDYNSKALGSGPVPPADAIMLALQVYYFFDAAKEDDWEPLLIILQEVNSTLAALLRFLIKLEKIWKSFVEGWNRTIGPLVASATSLPDALTGGLISEFKVVIEELQVALKTIGEQELLTYKDIFTGFDTCVQKGFDEQSFLWSDMSHYRRPAALCQSLIKQAEALRGGEDGENRFQQFLAFSLGYITHVGTDVVAHAFVNEQCGGPFRNHPQRHHLIENHIDAWNYSQTMPGGVNQSDPWGANATYPDLSMCALWFAVQITPDQVTADNPQGINGAQRPDPLPADPADRKKALDVDGEMPLWMAEAIVLALKETFEKHPHPKIFGGDAFQSTIDQNLLTKVVMAVTGHGLDRPFHDLLDAIAPAPPPGFSVPRGFPLPWQIQTIYRIMISFYKFQFNGSWELQKPRKPDFIITPPASDFENLLQPPDFSGADSGNPIEDICSDLIALFEWAVKELEAAVQLAEDLIKMAASPGSYLFRLGLYELAMMIWDVIIKTHDILVHTGFSTPHSEQHYDDGELRLPNEIDLPLITLGGSVDSAFRQALADAIDPLSNLDTDQSAIGVGHSVLDSNYPYYPVLRTHRNANGTVDIPLEAWEFHRPWAYPNWSPNTADGKHNTLAPTPTETYDPSKSDADAPPGPYKPLRPGPYAVGTRPNVFFDLGEPVDAQVRKSYESARTPFATDRLNEAHLVNDKPVSPLGNPVPFSAYLIGRLTNDPEYSTQFNLDSDRAFAYLTWDWIRKDPNDKDANVTPDLGSDFDYVKPVVAPESAPDWHLGPVGSPPTLKFVDPPLPLQVKYVDPPDAPPPLPPIR